MVVLNNSYKGGYKSVVCTFLMGQAYCNLYDYETNKDQ